MEKEKYFVPDIEDIRVGYECRIVNTFFLPSEWDDEDKWSELKPLTENGVEMVFKTMHNAAFVRVPYLTKEQIEAEGWKQDEFWKGSPRFEKKINEDSYYSLTLNADNQIVITKSYMNGWSWTWTPYYSGGCKDVNTFRQICKLLEI